MNIDLHRKFIVFMIIAFLLVVLLVVYLSRLFISSIIFAIFFVYLLNPIYNYVLTLTRKKHLSSFATVSFASAIIILLAFFVANNLSLEISGLVDSLGKNEVDNTFFSNSIINLLRDYFPNSIMPLLRNALSGFSTFIIPKLEIGISVFVTDLPLYIAQIILMIFFIYYFLIDGKATVDWLSDTLPEKVIVCRFIKELDNIYYILFRVHFFIAIVSGAVASIGFYLIGIPYPLTWGILLGFVSLIPQLGPSGVFLPMTLYYLISGDLIKAISVFAFGEIFLVLLPEYVIRPKIVSIGASIHPVITILAFTGPAFLIGPAGVIIGPTIYGIALAGYRTIMWLQRF